MIDHVLLLLEILVLLYMLKLDRSNHEAIKVFLKSRTEWYARRARAQMQQAQMKKAPEPKVPLSDSENETVAILSEDEVPTEPPVQE